MYSGYSSYNNQSISNGGMHLHPFRSTKPVIKLGTDVLNILAKLLLMNLVIYTLFLSSCVPVVIIWTHKFQNIGILIQKQILTTKHQPLKKDLIFENYVSKQNINIQKMSVASKS